MTPRRSPAPRVLGRLNGLRVLTYVALGVAVLIVCDWMPFPVLRLGAGLVAPVWLAAWVGGSNYGLPLALAMPVILGQVEGGWVQPSGALTNFTITIAFMTALGALALFVGRPRPEHSR